VNVRRLAAAALVAGAVLATSGTASATCYVGQVDICDKPTDPYTQPITNPIVRTAVDTVFNGPAGPAVATATQVYSDAYSAALCLVGDYWWC
jgi:hypothetical protein